MFNHVVYDVFVKQDGKDGDKMFGRCRFQDDLEAFTREGLKFRSETVIIVLLQQYALKFLLTWCSLGASRENRMGSGLIPLRCS